MLLHKKSTKVKNTSSLKCLLLNFFLIKHLIPLSLSVADSGFGT